MRTAYVAGNVGSIHRLRMALWHRTRVNPLPGMNKDRTLYQLANAYCRRWLEKARSEDLDDAVLSLRYSLLTHRKAVRILQGHWMTSATCYTDASTELEKVAILLDTSGR